MTTAEAKLANLMASSIDLNEFISAAESKAAGRVALVKLNK